MLAGKPVVAPGWSAEFTATPFTIRAIFPSAKSSMRTASPARIQLQRAADRVADTFIFQDRNSRQRFFRVDVSLQTEEKLTEQPEAEDFRVRTRQPLPVGHTYDLSLMVCSTLKAGSRCPTLKVLRSQT